MTDVRTGPVVVVVNPTKFDDLAEVREEVSRFGADHGVDVRLVETTEDDPGFGQTREALEAGAAVVCALGGDGTVRAVAEVLAGTGVPLGLLPGGTGNLLARNLDVPMSSISEGLTVVVDGTDRVIDVGWLELDPDEDADGDGASGHRDADNVHAFTVMAGLGFDAEIMEDAPEAVKDKVGWAAYVASASKHLRDKGFRARVTVDGHEVGSAAEPRAGAEGGTEAGAEGASKAGAEGEAKGGTGAGSDTRTVVIGNCGTLTGGITLLPDAVVDDGILDVAAITPSNLAQWLGVAARVFTGTDDGGSIARRQGTVVEVTVDPAQPVEVDGDGVGTGSRLRATITPGALVVRVPRES